MASHKVKGAWFDKSGRRHNVEFDADTADRNTISDTIRSRYAVDTTKAGRGVQLNFVGNALGNRSNSHHSDEEDYRQDVTSSADYDQGSSAGNIHGQDLVNYGPSSGGELTGVVALVAILAVLILISSAIATFGAFLTGPVAAFGAYKGLKKLTGKDKDDYNEVATGQSKSIGTIICLILILSSGVFGARWGHDFAAEVNSSDTTTEQISQ